MYRIIIIINLENNYCSQRKELIAQYNYSLEEHKKSKKFPTPRIILTLYKKVMQFFLSNITLYT